ncbi:MAG: branched-chain amino acid ABC transporter permease [Deltaproteobacteria bacterium]|nr:branched-chain amino acid ABC transporter permease [Deltaproteobacteria bacterium]
MVLQDRQARSEAIKSIGAPIFAAVLLIGVGYGLDATSNPYTQFVMLLILTNVVLATSLNLVNGFTGQFSLGHAGFMAVGAYTSAWLVTRPELAVLPDYLRFLLLPIAAGLLAAVAGYIVGLPSLRLRGDYLAIVTLGFGEIIRVILLNSDAVGGARGMYGIPSTAAVPSLGMSEFVAQFSVASIWTVVTFVTLWRIVHSSKGRAFLSVREDEIAAEAMGINITQTKVRAFVISAFFAGVGGALFAHSVKYLNPATFTFTKSVDIIIMIVLGGMGSFSGSVIAAAIITVLPEMVLRELQQITGVDLRMVIYSLMLILFMILRPAGILGTREATDIFKSFRSKSKAT